MSSRKWTGGFLVLFLNVTGCHIFGMTDPWEETGVMAIKEGDRIVALSDVRLPQKDNERLPHPITYPITLQLGHFAAKEWPLRYFRAFIAQLPIEINGLVLSTDFPADRVAIINSHFACAQFLQIDKSLENQIQVPLCQPR